MPPLQLRVLGNGGGDSATTEAVTIITANGHLQTEQYRPQATEDTKSQTNVQQSIRMWAVVYGGQK
eukprot:scaffold29279_cov73-Cyclotella_meneghiniana.AAC.2